MAGSNHITHQWLIEHLHYDPLTGLFTRKLSGWGKQAGDIVGNPEGEGYTLIQYRGLICRAHRLAWFYMTGSWPEADVDHEDGDRTNNRWVNLRIGSRRFNLENQRKAKPGKKGDLPLGVFIDSTKRGVIVSYKACLNIELGMLSTRHHPTPKDAHQSYVEMKRMFHEGCTL